VRGHVPERWGYWNDIGRVGNYLDANRALLDGAIPWVGPGNDEDMHGPCLIADSARIEVSATVGPHVTIGEGAVVGAGATVQGSVLWPDAQVAADARVSDSVVGGPEEVVDHDR